MLDDLNNGNLDKIRQNEEQIGIDRNSGNAGAGGAVASKGEKLVNDVVQSHNDEEFAKENREEIRKKYKRTTNYIQVYMDSVKWCAVCKQ